MKSLVLLAAILGALPSTVWAQFPAGSEFEVNTYTTDVQFNPWVASDANRNFVVVWASLGQDGSDFGIFGQRFSAAGIAQGSEFQVNSYATNTQTDPVVASDANGNFVVVWGSVGPDGSGSGVFGRRFSASGIPQSTEFQINSYTTGFQGRPAVASDASGDFVVVWQSAGQDGSGYGTFGRRFNASGASLGSEFRVNSYTTNDQRNPAVASDPTGNFVVVWESFAQNGTFAGIFGQRFDAAGAPQGSEVRVHSQPFGYHVQSAVASDANGNFVVVCAGSFGSVGGIVGRRFDASGAPLGDDFLVTTNTSGIQTIPIVSSDASGNFVVVWESTDQDGSGFGVFGRRFTSTGQPDGGEFQLSSYTTNNQNVPVVASSPDGDFVVVWQGNYPDSSYSIFGRRYGDIIFEDGFDSGDPSRWSSASTDGGDLSVSGAAAMAGTAFGLQAVVNDTNALFVQDDTPSAESRYRARFYVDPNGFDPGEATGHLRVRILIAFDPSSRRVITLVLRRRSGAYSVEARVRRSDGSRADTGFFPITDAPHFFEYDWQRATGPGASNGSLQLWIDGVSVATMSGLDNDQSPIEFVRMGALSVKGGAGGTLHFDQLESRRQRLIGPE
jgi:hypothetical protein